MKRIAALFICLHLIVFSSIAQDHRLFIPKEIKEAYEKGTRSYDGQPGPNYWQNSVDYDIEVTIEPNTRELTGSETIVFHNNSPDDLSVLVVRLYHDVFRKGNQRGMRVNPDDINDGVEISRLVVDGIEIDLLEKVRRQRTNMVVTLNEPIVGSSKATIEVDWKMVIPLTTRRTGAYDSTSFFVAYWYPQIAVYDDLFGWDGLAYDFSTEFYNNLGNYKVKISAPKNFSVVATGVLQNAQNVFHQDKLELYEKAKNSDQTVTIVSQEDIKNQYQHQSGTWHYQASDVTDFSFCLSDHFVWDAAMQKVEDRKVLINSFYNINVADKAGELTRNQQKTMKHFSEDVPGVPYPYPEFTTCVMGVGGGGMETPMMANNGGPGLGVTVHEMFHTYFPMYVRVNEKRFAWMDEGWADFNTAYVTKKYFRDNSDLLIENFTTSVQGTLGTISDLPLITSSQFMDNSNYGYASYPLPAFMYSILHHHLGEDMFRKCYAGYIRLWAKKSPSPYDFFYTFERVSGQDLSWFWEPWFFGFGDVDITIEPPVKGELTIRNMGNRPVPVVVSVEYNDGTTWNADYSAGDWGTANTMVKKIPKHKNISTLTVNRGIPDSNILDNFYPPLPERYGDFKLTKEFWGEYAAKEFPVSIVISEKDDLVYVALANTGLGSYMMPNGDNSMVSLSNDMILNLAKDESGTVSINLELKSFGVTLTGDKK